MKIEEKVEEETQVQVCAVCNFDAYWFTAIKSSFNSGYINNLQDVPYTPGI